MQYAGHVVDCLSYLIAIGAIQLRCVLMDQGMFHKKLWIIRSHDVRLAVHGSGNLTARGLFVNGEQMTVDRAMDGWCVCVHTGLMTLPDPLNVIGRTKEAVVYVSNLTK